MADPSTSKARGAVEKTLVHRMAPVITDIVDERLVCRSLHQQAGKIMQRCKMSLAIAPRLPDLAPGASPHEL